MNLDQLRALAAVVDHGTFDAAARALHITPSAVSQRIKALEAASGQVLVRRTLPCAATPAGEVLLRMARAVALLEADTRAALGLESGAVAELPAVVNADSLATWLVPLLREAAGWPDVRLQLHVEDQEHSLALLRAGEVLGALTTEPVATAGCRVHRVGVMRYLPVAATSLVHRHTSAAAPDWTGLDWTGLDWATLPGLRYNAKDDLQAQYLLGRGVHPAVPPSQVPSSHGFRDAVLAGLGWGLLPEGQLVDDAAGRPRPGTADLARLGLTRLARDHVDVTLYWHVWKVPSPRLERLTEAVLQAARTLR